MADSGTSSASPSPAAAALAVRRLLRIAWWSLAALVVTLALALSAARLMLPGMSEYRNEIEDMVAGLVGRPVEIGSLDAAWHGMSPVLRLKRVVVHDEALPNGMVRIDEVQVALDILQSLAHRQWRTAGLSLIGFEAAFTTDLIHRQHNARLLEILEWLSFQHSIAVDDVSIVWRDPGLFGEPLALSDVSLQLANEGGRHQFLVQAQVPGAPGARLLVAADLTGAVRVPEAMRGRVYLKTEGLDLARGNHWLAAPALRVAGNLDLELWAGLFQGRLQWGSGSVEVNQPRATGSASTRSGFSAERLSSNFRWERVAGEWRLSLREFAVERDQRQAWPASNVGVAVTTGAQWRIRGHASRIVLQEVQPILSLLPWIDENALIMVERLQPRGQLLHSAFQFSHASGPAPAFALRAAFEDLQFASSEGLPGASGLSGTIEGNLQAGIMRLDSRGALLSAPGVFAEPVDVTRLQGMVRWQRYANLFRIETGRMQIESGELDVLARMQMDWPYREAAPWLDLQLSADEVPLAAVRSHLPERVMSPKAVAWLKNAFRAGVATNVRCLVQGPVDQLPFDENQGRLEASFDFSEVVLDYHPQWGRLKHLRGSARFLGASLRVSGAQGQILDSPVQSMSASIDDLRRPVLQAHGSAAGALAGMLRYVETTPLGEHVGDFLERVKVRGKGRLKLDLTIPLKTAARDLAVNGNLVLQNNTLELPAHDLSLERIKGAVTFTRDTVSGQGITAEVLDAPVRVSIFPWQGPQEAGTQVKISGSMDLVALASQHLPRLAAHTSGVADWQLVLLIPRGEAPTPQGVEVELRSDLKGIRVDLPPPLRKRPEQKREMVFRWLAGQAGAPMELAYGDAVHGALVAKEGGGLERGELRFGGASAQLPPQPQLRLVGQLDDFDGSGWIDLIKPESTAAAAQVSGSQDAVAVPLPPLRVALTLRQANLFGYRFENVGVQSRPADPWQFALDGPDAGGLVLWTPGRADQPPRLELKLDRLVLRRGVSDGGAPATVSDTKPQQLPQLDVSVDALSLGERSLGSLRLQGKRLPQGMRFAPLTIEGDAVSLTGEASWLDIAGRQRTHVRADISDGSLDELLKLFGDSGSIKGGKLSGRLELNWPGGPRDFSLASVEGDAQMTALNGRLVDVEEGAGKLLNLFSLNSLQRRLALDFSDLTKGGFSFDSMEGHVVVMDGNAFTNDLTIRGSSAVIEIAGRTGLVAKDYDQLVTVTPQLSASLPIAGAIAGGPAVGAAVFLAEKLVGDEFNRISRVQYQVSGPWDAPKYRKLRRERGDGVDGVDKQSRAP